MKLLSKLIPPIVWFATTVMFNSMLAFELYDRPAYAIVIVAILTTTMAVGTGMYVMNVLTEYSQEQALKELKEKKDEN